MFSSINEVWNKDPVKEITHRLKKGEFQEPSEHINSFNFKDKLSENNSLSLISENTISRIPKFSMESFMDTTDTSDSKCACNIRHLNKCPHCYRRLKKIMRDKIEKRRENLMANEKVKKIKSVVNKPDFPWAHIVLIALAIVIIILLIILLMKK